MKNLSDQALERIAEHAHEANRVYCQSIGDDTQVAWNVAPENIKESARAGVRFINENPASTPEQSHESWLAFKRSDGWVFGLLKDLDLKTHPCMVPYPELPPAQRAKDLVYTVLVKSAILIEERNRGN